MCRGWGKYRCVVFRRNWEEVWLISPGAVLVFSVLLFFFFPFHFFTVVPLCRKPNVFQYSSLSILTVFVRLY